MAKSVERVIKVSAPLSKTGSTINFLPSDSVSFNSQKITNLATPTASTDAATKGYVDSSIPSTASFSTKAFSVFLA